jgi:hypothetical protein
MQTLRLIFLAIACWAGMTLARAQELDARVTVNHQKVEGTNTSVFESLETTLTEFINTRQWTNLQFQPNERISCDFNITISSYNDATGETKAELLVQSSRPVFNSAYTTTVFSTSDNSFNFTYREFDQLEFRLESVDNELTALIAYYVYLIIGMDLDSMSPLGGTEQLETVRTIVNNAQSFLLSAKGWKPFEDDKNRYAIINGYLDNAMEPYRQFQYEYYRNGLDVMVENPERGRAGITESMALLKKAFENKTLVLLPQLFTEYKREELVNIYNGKASAQEREEVVELLKRINPSQITYWRKIK